MGFFKNMDEPGTNDISKHPGYASLPEDVRKEVNNRYETVYNNNVNRMGIRIAQGIAYTTAAQMCEAFVAEKHIGFKKLAGEIEGEGKSKASADAIAASIGRKKYGAKAMAGAAKHHKALGENEVMDETDIEFKDPQGDYARNPEGATYEAENPFAQKAWAATTKARMSGAKADHVAAANAHRIAARQVGGAEGMRHGVQGYNHMTNYQSMKEGEAQNFQDANDAMVGMTESEINELTGYRKFTHMFEVDDFGVTQQAHLNIPYPQSPGGDSDVITHAATIMYNPANAFLNAQGDHEDSGPKGIQKVNHRMKGMNDTASQNEDEETSEFKPTPECVKACHQNGKHSPHCQHNHQFDEEVISAAAGYIKHRAEVSGITESVEDPKKKVSPVEKLNEAFHEIGHGDHVTIRTPQNQERKGKAVMKSSHGGWVLNMGGPHGTPGLVDQKNYVKHTKAKNKAPNSLAMRRLTGEEVTISSEYAKLMAEEKKEK